METGGVFYGGFPESKTRRGRVQNRGNICPTITARNQDLFHIQTDGRIRRLTPKECFRLQGVSDTDADKIININSDTQCYKQTGNSICVPAMAALFLNLNIAGVLNREEVKEDNINKIPGTEGLHGKL